MSLRLLAGWSWLAMEKIDSSENYKALTIFTVGIVIAAAGIISTIFKLVVK
jgi:hypothetical protein